MGSAPVTLGCGTAYRHSYSLAEVEKNAGEHGADTLADQQSGTRVDIGEGRFGEAQHERE